jgi:hypothetical protein
MYEENEGAHNMTKLTPTVLEDYEIEDPQWWCHYHKTTIDYLVLRLIQHRDAKSDEERAKIMALIDVVVRNTEKSQ